jgi:hypothetical protein
MNPWKNTNKVHGGGVLSAPVKTSKILLLKGKSHEINYVWTIALDCWELSNYPAKDFKICVLI